MIVRFFMLIFFMKYLSTETVNLLKIKIITSLFILLSNQLLSSPIMSPILYFIKKRQSHVIICRYNIYLIISLIIILYLETKGVTKCIIKDREFNLFFITIACTSFVYSNTITKTWRQKVEANISKTYPSKIYANGSEL